MWIIFLFCYVGFQQEVSNNPASSLRAGANIQGVGWDAGWPKPRAVWTPGISEEVKDVPSPDSPQLGLLNRKKHL